MQEKKSMQIFGFAIASLLVVSSTAFVPNGPLLAFVPSAITKASTTTSFMTATTTPNTISTLEAEALSKFFTPERIEKITLENADGGVSNRMSFITVPTIDDTNKTNRYLLRIYNNGGNSRVVRFEHEILRQLDTIALSFAVPKALPLLDDPANTHTLLTSGDESCIFEVIPRVLPKLQSVQEIGRASGELHTAMSKLSVPRTMTDQPPYHELFKVHHAITKDKFYNHIASEAFDDARDDINKLVQYVRDMEERLTELKNKNFPEQLIHGDLHYDNVLIDPTSGQVTGLLDFEYCGFDWRAMELAVCLSKYSGEPEPLTYFEDFVKGYAQTAFLTPDEIDAVPDLMVLRILSNVVFFVGRTLTGEDFPAQLTSRAGVYNSRIQWLLDNKKDLSAMISREMEKSPVSN